MEEMKFNRVTENLIEIVSLYERLKRKYDYLTDIDSMDWKHFFVDLANEFEVLYEGKDWNDSEDDYYETIEKFAEKRILEWGAEV